MWHVTRNYVNDRKWKPDRTKALRSIAGNLIVLVCLLMFAQVAHLHLAALEILYVDTFTGLMGLAAVMFGVALLFLLRDRISLYSHRFLRLPLRTGLFPNFERTRFLRERIPAERMRRSPIKLVMTAAQVNEGTERCFTNFDLAALAREPGVESTFVNQEVASVNDLLLAVIASSAFPIVYETVPLQGTMFTDGGIVSNQPIRPAIRLGADVLFLVMVEPRSQRRGEIKTFLDLGVRAIDILMSQNLRTDLRILNSVNAQCAQFAEELGLRPEQVCVNVGSHRYRYLKPILVEPSAELSATVLDFDGQITAPAMLTGYRDGVRAVREFAEYVQQLPSDLSRREIRLVAEKTAASAGRD
jgi:hypothetical protein